MSDAAAIEVENLRHRYGKREALAGVSLQVAERGIVSLLGPNGSGKTTLFKILSTLLPPVSGSVRIFGHDVARQPHAVRRCLGIVFQHPSLDPKLTVRENLLHQGHLYGLHGRALRLRLEGLLAEFGLAERGADLVATLSGGLQRRVELAKALLHEPRLLLLDEPSTGLDPGARHDLTRMLQRVRHERGATILLTTHILDDAEQSDRVGIIDHGRVIAEGTPAELKARVGGDVISLQAARPDALLEKLRARFACEAVLVDGMVRIERAQGHEFVRDVVEAFPEEVQSITFGKPTLEDVFVHLTGHRLWLAQEGGERQGQVRGGSP